MAGTDPRKQMEILQRRKVVADLYLRETPIWKIGQSLEVDPKTINRDLKAVRAEWLASSVADLSERKARELAKIDAMERTYTEAWERSRQPRKITSAKKRTNQRPPQPDGKPAPGQDSNETFLREELRDGDPRFLDGILRCIEMRLDIFGLRKAKPDESGGDTFNTLVMIAGQQREQFFSALGTILEDAPEKKALVGELIRAQAEAIQGKFEAKG